MIKQSRIHINVALMMVGVMGAANVHAVLDTQTYGFYNITHNSAADALIGEAQLSVQVSDYGTGGVGFKFMNAGPADCVITEIYLQNGSLLEFISIDESLLGVDYQEDEVGSASPGNLPGGRSMGPQFIASQGFSIKPIDPAPYWGVEPGEWVEIMYSLQSGTTYANIIDELNNADLRVGIHVQAYADGGSESFVNVPEMATMSLLGLGGLALRKRRKV